MIEMRSVPPEHTYGVEVTWKVLNMKFERAAKRGDTAYATKIADAIKALHYLANR